MHPIKLRKLQQLHKNLPVAGLSVTKIYPHEVENIKTKVQSNLQGVQA